MSLQKRLANFETKCSAPNVLIILSRLYKACPGRMHYAFNFHLSITRKIRQTITDNSIEQSVNLLVHQVNWVKTLIRIIEPPPFDEKLIVYIFKTNLTMFSDRSLIDLYPEHASLWLLDEVVRLMQICRISKALIFLVKGNDPPWKDNHCSIFPQPHLRNSHHTLKSQEGGRSNTEQQYSAHMSNILMT